MDISVVIPSYKPQEYLWECLDSLDNQTLSKKHFEIVLVLNGCCEPFNTEILDYINNHPQLNFKYVQVDAGGVSNARNIALQACSGDYITFIDDDDYVSPKYLESLLNHASRQYVSIANTFAFSHDNKKQLDNYSLHKAFNHYNKRIIDINEAKPFFQGVVRKLIHRSVIADRLFDTRLRNGEDSLFMFLISDKINKIVPADEDAIYYRRIRNDSANYSNKGFWYVLKWRMYLIIRYFCIYLRNPLNYNCEFFITRVLGSVKTIILSI